MRVRRLRRAGADGRLEEVVLRDETSSSSEDKSPEEKSPDTNISTPVEMDKEDTGIDKADTGADTGIDKAGTSINGADTGIDKAEPRKQAKKQPTKHKFVRPKKPCLPGGFMNEMLADSTAYSRNVTTFEEQAERESNFIGSAFYYDLSKTVLHPELGGDYIIAYSRPVGADFDRKERSTTMPLNMQNKITIVTELPKAIGERAQSAHTILGGGSWAAGILPVRGLRVGMAIDNVAAHPQGFSPTALVKMLPPEADAYNYNGNTPDYLFGCALREEGSSISFGIKVMTDGWNEERHRRSYFGFQFLKLEIACFNPMLGRPDRQLIVAVKVPKLDEGDVSSSYALVQDIRHMRDLAILDANPRVQNLAHWDGYAVNRKYREKEQSEDWVPSNLVSIGLLPSGRFDPNELERTLLFLPDRVAELANIHTWLTGVLCDEAGSMAEPALHEAKAYVDNRLQGIRGERRMREEEGIRRGIMYQSPKSPKSSVIVEEIEVVAEVSDGSGCLQLPEAEAELGVSSAVHELGSDSNGNNMDLSS